MVVVVTVVVAGCVADRVPIVASEICLMLLRIEFDDDAEVLE